MGGGPKRGSSGSGANRGDSAYTTRSTTGAGGGSGAGATATPAEAIAEKPSGDSTQSEPSADEDWCNGHRRSHSDFASTGVAGVLAAASVPRQITRIPLNGISATNAPSTSVLQRETKAWAPYAARFTLSNRFDSRSVEDCSVEEAQGYRSWSPRNVPNETERGARYRSTGNRSVSQRVSGISTAICRMGTSPTPMTVGISAR